MNEHPPFSRDGTSRDAAARSAIGDFDITPKQEAAFWRRVKKTDGCWLWTGHINRGGYGTLVVGTEPKMLWDHRYGKAYPNFGKARLAHRIAYRLLVGPIPDGMPLDHVKARGCTSTRCVNPAHLEPVTHLENARRQSNFWRDRDRCSRGHLYTPETMRWAKRKNGYVYRVCKACRGIIKEGQLALI